jgi:hypothetical protein
MFATQKDLFTINGNQYGGQAFNMIIFHIENRDDSIFTDLTVKMFYMINLPMLFDLLNKLITLFKS